MQTQIAQRCDVAIKRREIDAPLAAARRLRVAGVNLKTAKALSLNIPQSLLLRADKVIE